MEESDYRTTYELEDHNWWFVGTRRICLDLVENGRARGGRVLDVGCGTGILMESLPRFGPTVVGLDYSATALEFCRERGAERLVLGSGDRLPFDDASFDVVTAIGVIEHIDDDRGALAEWARVLRPGGSLVFLTSAYMFLWSGHDVSNHHTRRYRVGDVRSLVRSVGLRPERVSYVNCFLFPPIALVRLVERVRRRGRPPAPHKDTGEVPGPLNSLLTSLLRVEGWFIRRRGLPFGVSIVGRAVKP